MRMLRSALIIIGLFVVFTTSAFAQEEDPASVCGRVWDQTAEPGSQGFGASVSIPDLGRTETTGTDGYWCSYWIILDAQTTVTVTVVNVPSDLTPNGTTTRNVTINPGESVSGVNFSFYNAEEQASEYYFPTVGGDFSPNSYSEQWYIPQSESPYYREVGAGYDQVSSRYNTWIRTQAFCPTDGGRAWLTHYVAAGHEDGLDEWAASRGMTYIPDYQGQGAMYYENIAQNWDCSETTTIEISQSGPSDCERFDTGIADHHVFGIGLDADENPYDSDDVFYLGFTSYDGSFALPFHAKDKGLVGLYFVANRDEVPIYGASEIQFVIDTTNCEATEVVLDETNPYCEDCGPRRCESLPDTFVWSETVQRYYVVLADGTWEWAYQGQEAELEARGLRFNGWACTLCLEHIEELVFIPGTSSTDYAEAYAIRTGTDFDITVGEAAHRAWIEAGRPDDGI